MALEISLWALLHVVLLDESADVLCPEGLGIDLADRLLRSAHSALKLFALWALDALKDQKSIRRASHPNELCGHLPLLPLSALLPLGFGSQ